MEWKNKMDSEQNKNQCESITKTSIFFSLLIVTLKSDLVFFLFKWQTNKWLEAKWFALILSNYIHLVSQIADNRLFSVRQRVNQIGKRPQCESEKKKSCHFQNLVSFSFIFSQQKRSKNFTEKRKLVQSIF